MQASAQAFDDEAGFDRAAAEALLRELRGEPAARRRTEKAAPRQSVSPAAIPDINASVPRKAKPRALAALVIAVLTPVAIGAGLAWWSAARPLRPEPGVGLEAAAGPPAVNAYAVTTPVAVGEAVKPHKPVHGPRQHGRRPPARSRAAAPRRPRIERPVEDLATDIPF